MPSEGSPLLSIFCLDKLSTAGLVHQVRAAIFAANLGPMPGAPGSRRDFRR